MLNLYKYAKSFVYEEKKDENVWISVLILFVDNGKMWVDTGFIIDGEFSINTYSFFSNFRNFIIINDKLHYKFPDYIKEIDPIQVHLHLKIGKSPFSLPKEKLDNWRIHFSSSNNTLYKAIQHDLKKEKIQLITLNETIKTKKKINIVEAENPLFHKKQVYNDSSVMFSHLNIDFL